MKYLFFLLFFNQMSISENSISYSKKKQIVKSIINNGEFLEYLNYTKNKKNYSVKVDFLNSCYKTIVNLKDNKKITIDNKVENADIFFKSIKIKQDYYVVYIDFKGPIIHKCFFEVWESNKLIHVDKKDCVDIMN